MSTRNRLVDISTHWSGVRDPAQFALRYAPAVHVYLTNLLPDPNDADDVAQEFFLQVSWQGFAKANPERGRFRNYLAVSVRNAARKHLQKRPMPSVVFPEELTDATPDLPLAEWRKCLIDRVMRTLHHHERTTPGNLFSHCVDHPRRVPGGRLNNSISSCIETIGTANYTWCLSQAGQSSAASVCLASRMRSGRHGRATAINGHRGRTTRDRPVRFGGRPPSGRLANEKLRSRQSLTTR